MASSASYDYQPLGSKSQFKQRTNQTALVYVTGLSNGNPRYLHSEQILGTYVFCSPDDVPFYVGHFFAITYLPTMAKTGGGVLQR